jgi:hypothetical protein
MSNTYYDWPFLPHHRRFREEEEVWWLTCHVSGPVDRRLAESAGWTIVTGGPGTGKSTALLARTAGIGHDALRIEYPPARWPGNANAWLPGDSRHLAQMITAAGWAFYELFEREPHRAAALGSLQREFFRALIERTGFLGRRQYDQLLELFDGETAASFRAVEIPDGLRQLPASRRDLEMQAKDVIWLARALSLSQVVFSFDLASDQPVDEDSLAELYGGLDLMGSREFIVVAAMPERLLAEQRLISGSRSRVESVVCEWAEADCRRMAARHLCAALGREPDDGSLAGFAGRELLAQAGEMIANEYGRPTPAGWVNLAETLLYVTHRSTNALRPPLGVEHATALLSDYFQRHFPLRLDRPAQGVWRGPHFIRLDEQPFRFVELLAERRGAFVNWDDYDLQLIAGSKTNANTLAARARKEIEPFSRPHIYLINHRGSGGYCLTNVAQSSVTDSRQKGDRSRTVI